MLSLTWAQNSTRQHVLEAVQDYLHSIDTPSPAVAAPSAALPSLDILDVQIDGDVLVLNFTQGLLRGLQTDDSGMAEFESLTRRALFAAEEALGDDLSTYREYLILIEGRRLEQVLDELFPEETDIPSIPSEEFEAAAALSSKALVIVSPGHGLYQTELTPRAGCEPSELPFGWDYQRPCTFDTWEDVLTPNFALTLNDGLNHNGFILVESTRQLDRDAGVGISGQAAWLEAARYYIKSQGFAASIWDSRRGHRDDDIASRPLYANARNAVLLISIHTNAFDDEAARGLEILYDTSNGNAFESERLARLIYNEVLDDIRRNYAPDWRGRGVKGSNGNKGENRLAKMPSVIIEVGFHTNPNDNAALQDPKFQEIVAKAMQRGIESYLGVDNVTQFPNSPINRQPGGSQAENPKLDSLSPTFSWQAVNGASHYGLYILRLSDRVLIYENENISTTSLTLPEGMIDPAENYRWNMVAKQGRQQSPYSPLLYFSTPVASNDAFALAQTLEGITGSVSSNSSGASREVNEPQHAGNRGGASLWFSWIAPASGQIEIDTLGSSFDTTLAVYKGNDLTDLSLVKENDDINHSNLQSSVDINITANTKYFIAVDGYNGATGNVKLNYKATNLRSSLQISFTGLPEGAKPTVVLLKDTTTNYISQNYLLSDLERGQYLVGGALVNVGGIRFRPNPYQLHIIEIFEGQASSITINYKRE